MATLNRQQLEQLRQNPRVRAFLQVISKSEGADYRTLVYDGSFNQKINNFADHPANLGWNGNFGAYGRSTAAGRYQFLKSTWNSVKRQAGLTDFSPTSQDYGAIQLLQNRGALGPLLAGDFRTAVIKSGDEWASLPNSNLGQGRQTWNRVQQWFNEALGGSSSNSGGVGASVTQIGFNGWGTADFDQKVLSEGLPVSWRSGIVLAVAGLVIVTVLIQSDLI